MSKTPQTKSLRYRSFEAVYKAAALPLMKFIVKRMNGDVEAAEEVFSRTALAALKGWYTFEHRSNYFTWICRIALNKMADYYREQVNQRSRIIAPGLEVLANIPSKKLSPDEKLALKELQAAVRDCLMVLPEDKRKLLYLRYWESMSLQKIAQISGLSPRAAEGQIYRAKRQLKEEMLKKYPDFAFEYT